MPRITLINFSWLVPVNRLRALASDGITPEWVYRSRRRFLAAAGAGAMAIVAGAAKAVARYDGAPRLAMDETLSPFEEVSTYNNFYEYSTDKKAIRQLAENLRPHPWQVEVKGDVANPRNFGVAELKSLFGVEERIYRLRCVEGWSAVIPWMGVPLGRVLGACSPLARAKYVRFVGPYDPSRFYGQRDHRLPWPYTEGLTIEEATHPLTLLATGMYGKTLPNQNGAPVRLVVPWKYGYKSLKSVVSIELRAERPETFWTRVSPEEYSFSANVDPDVPHPRWSQAREIRLGEMRKRPTLPFNGYAPEVAHLYAGVAATERR